MGISTHDMYTVFFYPWKKCYILIQYSYGFRQESTESYMLLTQTKLAKMLGISQAAISYAIKRKKLVMSDHGIDTEDPRNNNYIHSSRKSKNNKNGRKGTTDKEKKQQERQKKTEEMADKSDYLAQVATLKPKKKKQKHAKIDIEELNETNIEDYSKVDIDKLKVIEQTKFTRLKVLKERKKLVDSDRARNVFSKIMQIEENELKTIPDNVSGQLAGLFGKDDPAAANEVRMKLEKEIFKVLRRVKDTINDFLKESDRELLS